MPVQVETRAKRDVVTLLSNVDVGFVSLVKHGANWTPFTAIKNDCGDVEMAGQVIQAILMPTDKDVNDLKDLYGDAWFSRVKTGDVEKHEHFTRFIQRAEEDFSETTREAAFHLVDAGRTGGYFVCGTLKAEKASADALTVPEDSMAQTLVQVTREVNLSFADVFYRKIDEYLRIIESAMELHIDPEKRISAHNDAWKAIDEFVRAAFSKLGESAVKMVRPDVPGIAATDTKPAKPGNDNRRGIDMTKEEVQGIVTEIVSKEVQNAVKAEVPNILKDGPGKIEAAPEIVESMPQSRQTVNPHEESLGVQNALNDLTAKLEKLEDRLSAVAKRQESLEHATVRLSSSPEDPSLRADDGDRYDATNPGAAFKGMFDHMVV